MEEEIEQQNERINYLATFKLILSLMSPHKRKFMLAFFYLVISTALNLLNPIITKYLIDTVIPSKNYCLLLIVISAYFANSLIFLVFNYLMRMKLVKTGQEIIVDLKNKMFKHILNLDLSFYSENPVGRLTARIESDTGTLYELFKETSVTIFKDILMFGLIFTIMAFYNLNLALLLMPIFVVVLFFIYIFVDKSSSWFVSVRKMTAQISAFLTEHLNGIFVLQSFGQEKFVCKKLDKLNEKKFKIELKAETMAIYFFQTILFLYPLSTATIFGIGGMWTIKNKVTVGILIMFILYLGQLFEPIFNFSEHVSIIQRSFSAGHRIFRILELKPKIVDIPRPHYINSVRDFIEFKNVWLRYNTNSPWVLKDISFKVPRGTSLAIVGETGGGKTTITNALFRFYLPEKGKILIDGLDINEIALQSLRKAIGLVQQDIYLFPGTIMDNLKLMDSSIPDSKVYDAINAIGLDSFFKKHSLDKIVVEKGANLSIGEKQVVSFIRAMVLDQEVLVLDEATSYIDPYTERLITGAIKNLIRKKTLIIIAHRLSTIKNVDQIILVADGKIREQGNHYELMAKSGIYSKFYKLQFGEK